MMTDFLIFLKFTLGLHLILAIQTSLPDSAQASDMCSILNPPQVAEVDKMKKIALIPAYEPDMKMIGLIKRLKNKDYDIIVVDDGSGKDFRHIFDQAEKNGAMVISHRANRGKGAAIKTALFYICLNYTAPYTVVTADADGQHMPEDVEAVCQKSSELRDTLILGSRHFDGDVPMRSRLGNTITRFVYSATSGAKIYDTQTGLRAFSDMLVPLLIDIPGSRYEYEMNVLMSFAKNRLPMCEVPIETVYIEDNRSSHFDTIRDSARIYKEILKFSGVSFISFLVDYGLFSLFMGLTGILTFSNILARVVSAAFNYTMNRKVVFKSAVSIKKSLTQYIALAVFILACNTAILSGLSYAGINTYIGKIITEVIMFFVSYTIQHSVIFKKKKQADARRMPAGKVAV